MPCTCCTCTQYTHSFLYENNIIYLHSNIDYFSHNIQWYSKLYILPCKPVIPFGLLWKTCQDLTWNVIVFTEILLWHVAFFIFNVVLLCIFKIYPIKVHHFLTERRPHKRIANILLFSGLIYVYLKMSSHLNRGGQSRFTVVIQINNS